MPMNPATQWTPAPDAIDFSVLDELRMLQDEGEPDLVAEVVQLFLEDGPARLQAIREATLAGQAVQLGKAAHGLKGSAANVGAVVLRALCERLEHMGKAGDISGCAPLLMQIEAEYPRVQSALEPLVRGAA